MKRLFIILAFVIPSLFFQLHAEQFGTKKEMDILEHRIKSLEHQVTFMRLYYDLQLLSTSLDKFAIDIYAYSTNIDLKIHQQFFNKLLSDVYQAYYDSALYNKNAMHKNMESLKTLYNSLISTYPFTKEEKSALKASYNVLISAYDRAEKAFDLFKVSVDGYESFL